MKSFFLSAPRLEIRGSRVALVQIIAQDHFAFIERFMMLRCIPVMGTVINLPSGCRHLMYADSLCVTRKSLLRKIQAVDAERPPDQDFRTPARIRASRR